MSVAEEAKVRAMDARNRLGIAWQAPVNIFGLLYGLLNVSILFRPLKTEVSGLLLRYQGIEIVLINSNRSLGHQYYTGAHELCHLLYHKDLTRHVCSVGLYDSRAPMEREADSFAGHFLVPDAALEYLLAKRLGTRRPLSINDCVFLEQYFQVSRRAMLIRLEQVGLIGKAQAEEWKTGIIRTARELGYDTSIYKPTGISSSLSDYAEKAKKALDEGLISRGKYEELLLEAELHGVLFDEDGEDE